MRPGPRDDDRPGPEQTAELGRNPLEFPRDMPGPEAPALLAPARGLATDDALDGSLFPSVGRQRGRLVDVPKLAVRAEAAEVDEPRVRRGEGGHVRHERLVRRAYLSWTAARAG